MKKHFYLLKTCLCALAVGVLAGCSAEVDNLQLADGMGAVKLSLNADTGFETTTKAVDEFSYEDLSLYTVQILKDGAVVNGCEWKGNALPEELVELDNGNYVLKAFTGEEYEGEAASTAGFYVAGEKAFNINSNKIDVAVECIPQCARVRVEFNEMMPEYFEDYYVEFTGTSALGSTKETWAKDDKDPVYLALTKEETVTATIKLVDKEGKVADDVIRTKALAPGKAWALKIAPALENGQLGISITIDESTVDHEVDIEIPSDWL